MRKEKLTAFPRLTCAYWL